MKYASSGCRPLRTIAQTILLVVLLGACTPRPFVPVNVGREYGNPKTPLVVTHISKKNLWSLNRVGYHHTLKRILCFDYACRKMIGRSKTLLVISREEYIKVIKRNAKRGFFKTTTQGPVIKKLDRDSVPAARDTVNVAEIKSEVAPVDHILKADSLVTLNEFLFETNSYKLRPAHFSELDGLSQFLQNHPTLEITISGHTDNTGDEHHNINLSTRRAKVVAEYLIGKGVGYEKVFYQGFGSAQPVSVNETEVGRGKNRRVEILIQNPKK
jgi:outer membrane protein OmpA-like peptidoglycan-associated protein